MVRSRKELSIFLSRLKVFTKAKPQLEQYPCDGNIAAEILWKAALNGDIQDKIIIDLGCGTGILGIGALILGAKHVEFIDIDTSVKSILEENITFTQEYFNESLKDMYSFTQKDILDPLQVKHLENIQSEKLKESNDKDIIVIMNPPFGTRKKHADKGFLKAGFKMSSTIYTIHKSSTEDFILAFCKDNNIHITWQERSSFPLKNTMNQHRKKIERIEVTLFRLEQ